MSNWRRLLRLLAALFAFAMIAAACGDSDDGDTSTGDDPAESDEREDTGGGLSQEDVEEAAADTADDTPAKSVDRSTLDAIWADAAATRQRVVDEITAKIDAGEWGVGDDNVLRGPAGFEIDLNDCPPEWSDTAGVTDDTIKVGATMAFTGVAAAWGDSYRGWQNYWDWVNDNEGGIGGRDLELILRDDAYVAAQTIEFFDELIEAENIFAYQGLGSPNGLAVYDKIQDECLPHLFHGSGHPAWGDPVNHPWTTGGLLSYGTETVLWGTWIKENLADELPVKVAGLVMDNDFGLAYELGFERFVEDNPDVISEFVAVRHDPAAPTLTNEVTTIAAADPDVFIAMTGGTTGCPQSILEVSNSGLREKLLAAFTASVCKGVSANMAPAGEAAEGWWIVGGGLKDINDPAFAEEPFMQFLAETVRAGGLDPTLSQIGIGYMWAYNWTEAMRIADALPGGLSRSNLILAVRNLEIWNPMLLDELTLSLEGNADSYLIEGSEFAQFDATAQSWTIVGNVVDVNGGSGNCAYDKDTGLCG